MSIERPEIVTDEHLDYLDGLRESGACNMFGAGEYVEATFGVDRREARTIVSYWMETFETRQAAAAAGGA